MIKKDYKNVIILLLIILTIIVWLLLPMILDNNSAAIILLHEDYVSQIGHIAEFHEQLEKKYFGNLDIKQAEEEKKKLYDLIRKECL